MIKRILIFTLLGLLLSGVGFFGYEFYELKKEIFKVTITSEEYIQGNPNGNLTVVYFSDYECNLCREFHPVLVEAMKDDGNIRLVQRPTAKNEWFVQLTSAVYAAGKQGKFFEMNDAIVQNWPVMSEKKLYRIAEAAGLNIEKLSRDIARTEIKNILKKNKDYLQMWKLPKFPALIIGTKSILMPDANNLPTKEQLLDHFKDARSFL